MIVTELTLQNYRAFRDATAIRTRPLTLVFGENNAGKSSVVRLLPSLVNSCAAGSRLAFTPVTLSAWDVNGKDFIYGKGTSTRVHIGFSFETAPETVTEVLYEIFTIDEIDRSIVSRLVLKKSSRVIADFEWEAAATPLKQDVPHTYIARHVTTAEPTKVSLRFNGLLPSFPIFDPNISKEDSALLLSLEDALVSLKNQLHWLGPLRHTPDGVERRMYTSNKLGRTGKEASQILANSYQQKTPLFDRVSQWFEVALKHKLAYIDGAFDGDALFRLALSPLGSPSIRVPIGETGTGIAQVLPVILLGEMAALGELGTNPILVLENPELHLHDSIHDDMGRFFAKVVTSPSKPQLIVETHSENILLAIEIAIAQKLLEPTDAAVSWVRRSDDGSSTVENVSFDNKGTPSVQWPQEAFSTAPHQAKKLFALQNAQVDGGN